ncbi:hypothetical protein ACWC4D_41550 [Streptomyces sp. NPDC001288]
MVTSSADDRREAVCAWLTANDIRPADVLVDADITIEDSPNGQVLRVEVFDLTPDGHKQLDQTGQLVATKFVTVPLKAQPPEWWQPQVKPTRDQLMAAIAKAAPSIRRALLKLPAECRYHGDQIEPHQPSYGREACCDTGEPSMRRRKAEEALRALTGQL